MRIETNYAHRGIENFLVFDALGAASHCDKGAKLRHHNTVVGQKQFLYVK
jgi:hypothetical protein